MSDPRNVAHDKKVKQEKAHARPEKESEAAGNEPAPAAAKADEGPTEHEQSVAVLSKLKELEFHSRANLETLAGLTLMIEDELKQKEFVDPVGELYGAQDAFQTKVAALVESYEAKCESLKGGA